MGKLKPALTGRKFGSLARHRAWQYSHSPNSIDGPNRRRIKGLGKKMRLAAMAFMMIVKPACPRRATESVPKRKKKKKKKKKKKENDKKIKRKKKKKRKRAPQCEVYPSTEIGMANQNCKADGA
jgi:hypothetical protein